MTLNICCVCLRIDKTLHELKKNLRDYLQDICSYENAMAKYHCCSSCEKSLKSNLDFRNKCHKSNEILQDWRTDNNKNKPHMKTLHKLLIKSLKTKEVTKIKKHNTNVDEISVKMKDEMPIEIVDCGMAFTVNYDGTIAKSNDGKIANDKREEVFIGNEFGGENNCNISDADISDEDDKFLIDCVKKEDGNSENGSKSKSNKKDKTNLCARLYTRKGLSDYAEYATVFDIQLFNTDEEARREVARRRLSEPYLSAAHRCQHCYTVYRCQRLLDFHMRWHDPSSEFACDICEMRFVTRKMVLNHKVKCHRGRFACKLCPLITYYGGAMKSHFEKHQGKTYKCHCERVFNHISSYLSHKRTTHSSEHVCVQCARTFVSALGLHTHTQKVHQGQSIDAGAAVRCESCALTFASRRVYTVHVLTTASHRDLADTLIACQYCGLSFEDVTQLKNHKRRLHPKKKDTNDIIKCKQCGEGGAGRGWRRRHYWAEHPRVAYHTVTDARLHLCHRCGKRFTNITVMKEHVRGHGGRPAPALRGGGAPCRPPAPALRGGGAPCRLCTAAFKSAAKLAVHMRIHNGVRRYSCDLCPKSFLHAAALSGHVRGVHGHAVDSSRETTVCVDTEVCDSVDSRVGQGSDNYKD